MWTQILVLVQEALNPLSHWASLPALKVILLFLCTTFCLLTFSNIFDSVLYCKMKSLQRDYHARLCVAFCIMCLEALSFVLDICWFACIIHLALCYFTRFSALYFFFAICKMWVMIPSSQESCVCVDEMMHVACVFLSLRDTTAGNSAVVILPPLVWNWLTSG